jgi:hypothetical protein
MKMSSHLNSTRMPSAQSPKQSTGNKWKYRYLLVDLDVMPKLSGLEAQMGPATSSGKRRVILEDNRVDDDDSHDA